MQETSITFRGSWVVVFITILKVLDNYANNTSKLTWTWVNLLGWVVIMSHYQHHYGGINGKRDVGQTSSLLPKGQHTSSHWHINLDYFHNCHSCPSPMPPHIRCSHDTIFQKTYLAVSKNSENNYECSKDICWQPVKSSTQKFEIHMGKQKGQIRM